MKSYTKFKAISPSRAIEQYARLNGGPVHTREIIALGLREGKVRARAQHVWTSTGKRLAEAWRNEPDRESYAKLTMLKKSDDVPTSTWWESVDWARDILDWNFRRGRLHVTTSNKTQTKIMLKRVRLHSDDVRKLLAPNYIEFDRPGIKKLEAWRMFWHEVVRLALKTGPEGSKSALSSFTNDGKVLDAINDSLSFQDDLLSDSHIQEISGKIAGRQLFNLSDKTALEEIELLRKTLKLTSRNRPRPR